MRSFLRSEQPTLENVPIKTGYVASATAQTVEFVPLKDVDILVNPAFPTYSLSFQTELMTHEYLHILQAEDSAINIQAFHQAVQLWFNNSIYGLPVPSSNYTKYYVDFELYSSGRYTLSDYPREEYAYIGTMLEEGNKRMFLQIFRHITKGFSNANKTNYCFGQHIYDRVE